MNESNLLKKKLKNAQGKALLTKTQLEYSKAILENIQKNPEILDDLLKNLEMSEDEFLSIVSTEKKENITFYEQTMSLIKKRKNNHY